METELRTRVEERTARRESSVHSQIVASAGEQPREQLGDDRDVKAKPIFNTLTAFWQAYPSILRGI
jgi:hypothetical protein